MNEKEIKRLFQCGFGELKFSEDEAEAMTFSGYGAVFGNMDAYGDVIAKGAFKASLAEAKKTGIWPAMLSQHGGWGMDSDSMTPIGVWSSLQEDNHGLLVEGKFAATPRGQEAYTLLKMTPRPAYNGLSIGYYPVEWANGTKPDEPRRTLKKIKLVEISLVTFPANDQARVNQVKVSPDPRSLEKLLCDAGLSRSQAKALVAEGYSAAFRACDEPNDAGEELKALLRKNISALRGQ